jgi:hypothetical protein
MLHDELIWILIGIPNEVSWKAPTFNFGKIREILYGTQGKSIHGYGSVLV